MAYTKQMRLPPGCGLDLEEPYLYNPYIHDPVKGFLAVKRLRVCLKCKVTGPQAMDGTFVCPKCQTIYTTTIAAPRAFTRLGLLAGRGGGKTKAGAHGAREEMMVPNSIGWVMGPTYKILHDSTFPTLVRLISPEWVAKWDAEHMDLRLKNGAVVSFRSLEDPDRARGPHGVSWGWFDEAAQCPERAYDVFEPTLLKNGGIIMASTTVLGYDWTYDRIEKPAFVHREPGYWFARWWTEENPIFRANPQAMAQLEYLRKHRDPAWFAQEYQAERRNAEGLVYDYSVIEKQCLLDDEQVRRLIPEWPAISPSRKVIVGLDSGADHPFGAVLIVVTEDGLVVVNEYLERQRAISQHIEPIGMRFDIGRFREQTWSANKNEANLRLEFGLKGIGIVQAENKHEIGIQRVQSWLYAGKIFFAYTVPRTIEQMRAYRYAANSKPSGEKKPKEQVFKFRDELPDAVRYALMAWPELPERAESTMTPAQKTRWDALGDKEREQIIRVREYNKAAERGEDLEATDENYPVGTMFGEDTTLTPWE